MIVHSIVDGQLGKRRQNARPTQHSLQYPLSFLLQDFSCVLRDEHVSYGNLGEAVPPFGLAFSSAVNHQDVLAVANEEGIVRLYNTESRDQALLKEWLTHRNAVFDLAWVPGEPQLVTAAGDQLARLWDVKSGELLGSFKGHLCSLKSVAFTPQDKAVFCTGGRDGNIMVWDMRCTKKDGVYKQVKQISGAHNKAETLSATKAKKKRSSSRGMLPSVDSQQSVTMVVFRDQHTLISSGAVDGVVKMWDLRKNYSVHHQDPTPLQTFPYPGSSLRTRLGYSGLVLDSSRSNVMCNCTDDNIYMFNISGAKTSPVAVFSGHQNASFYIRSSLSPDDQFLASGSNDGHAYIWKVSSPSEPPMMLQGHSDEVTSVSWCPTDFTKIASCSDDRTVRLWRLHRGTEEVQSRLGEANLVGWTRPKSPRKRLPPVESTPAKTPSAQILGGLTSPRAAACASNSASLPLPTSTASPLPSPARPKTPTSIQRWLSPRVLSPQNATAPPSEQRAKRRLEASARPCCGDEGGCRCVEELNPAKRGRAEHGLCCTEGTQMQTEGTQMQTEATQTMQTETTDSDREKENCCPAARNWLSAMGQRARKSPRRAEGRSPNSGSPHRMKKISTYFSKRTGE